MFSLDKIFKIFFDIAIEIKLKAIGFTQNPVTRIQYLVLSPFTFSLSPNLSIPAKHPFLV